MLTIKFTAKIQKRVSKAVREILPWTDEVTVGIMKKQAGVEETRAGFKW